jgi:hypothetical protein
MSVEGFGNIDEDNGFTDERVAEIGTACFVKGVQICREMMARFVEQGGDTVTAGSIRANWNPSWGADPGPVSDQDYEAVRDGFDPMACT